MDTQVEIRFLAKQLLHAGVGPLTERERRMVERIARRVRVAADVNEAFEERLTLGERIADRVAAVGGSWAFILGCAGFLVGWALLNAVVLAERAFDPYPFVFLNLLLSMVAALQAPVIMMSQQRQAAKDRMAAELDREVNLRAEVGVAALHEKVGRVLARLDEAEPAGSGPAASAAGAARRLAA